MSEDASMNIRAIIFSIVVTQPVQRNVIVVSTSERIWPSSTMLHINTYKPAVNITYYCEIDSVPPCAV